MGPEKELAERLRRVRNGERRRSSGGKGLPERLRPDRSMAATSSAAQEMPDQEHHGGGEEEEF